MAVLAIAVLLVLAIAPAHAYIDPGSGSFMLQLSLAALLAVLFALKTYWQRLRSSLARLLGLRGHRPPV